MCSGDVGICLGGQVGQMVLPGQRRRPLASYGQGMLRDIQRRWPLSRARQVPTRAGRLSTVLLRPAKARRLVVYLGGNAELFQDRIDEMRDDVGALTQGDRATAALGFNYPGFHGSGGTARCGQDLVDATRDLVEATMRQLQVDATSVVLKGHSIGGAVAALVAAEMHRDGRPVNLWCGRTFADVAGVAASSAPLASSTYWGLKGVSLACGWNLNCAGAFLSLPPRCRLCVHAHNDGVIHHSASLWRAALAAGDGRRLLLHGPSRRDDPHNVPLWALRDTEGRTGDTIFHAFCREVWGDD